MGESFDIYKKEYSKMINKISDIFSKEISVSKFIILITLLNMAVYHLPFYQYAISHLNIYSLNGILTFASILIAIFVITVVILFLLAVISIEFMKYFTVVIIFCNAIAVYFILTYNVILDITIMGNVLNTNTEEAISYYDPGILIYVIVFGLIPAFVISQIKIKKSKKLSMLSYGFSTIIIGVFLLYLNSKTWLWIDRHAKIMGGLSMPWSYIINPIRYKMELLRESAKYQLLPPATLDERKVLVVLIIGESARKANFSLYGYDRETNPALRESNITVLKNTMATTTYTTASINSMFSHTGSTSSSYEPLPSYLHRKGVYVVWRANNWGAPKIKVSTFEKAAELEKSCQLENCKYDEILLTGLLDRIQSSKNDKIFMVLHTKGSHGPTYYKRYPQRFEAFKPACKTVDLKECTNQELINAYDNTIYYTDYFISQTIKRLEQVKDRPVLMIYISDHGESLGEKNLYLHGTPYIIAPNVQKEIPLIIWKSKDFKGYVKQLEKYGHENIFHTILGALGVDSSVYNKKLDIMKQ